jgi:hypothetical protein
MNTFLFYCLCLLLLFCLFEEKYDIVGRLLRPGEKANVYPSETTTVDGAYSLHDKKRE